MSEAVQGLIHRYFNGSADGLVLHLIAARHLNADEVLRIQNITRTSWQKQNQ